MVRQFSHERSASVLPLIFKLNSRTGQFGCFVPVVQRGAQGSELFSVEIGGANVDLHFRVGCPGPKASCRRSLPNCALFD